ncbi:MAG: T9SS type A sorting domain-containing protein [Bacteroidota bacterium]
MKTKLIYTLALILYMLGAHSQTIVFQKIFGSIAQDNGYGVLQTPDSGYVFTGSMCTGNPCYNHAILTKTDKNGNAQWTKYHKTTLGISAFSQALAATTNGYVMSGFHQYGGQSLLLVNTNSVGDSLWTKTFDEPGYVVGYAVKQTQDNGFLTAGYILPSNEYYPYVAKTDANGVALWTKTLNITPTGIGAAHSVLETTGGYMVLGYAMEPTSGNNDIFITKLNYQGDTIWYKTIGGNNDDKGYSMIQTPDHGFMISGPTMSWGSGAYDAFLMKLDSNGVQQWFNTYGWIDNEYANCVAPTSDGGYIIAGSTQSFGAGNYDAYIVKTDSLGNEQWYRTFGGNNNDYAYSIQQTFDGGYIFVGMRGDNIQLVKLDGNGFTTGITEVEASGLSATIAPNPFSTQTTITTNNDLQNATVILYNALGQETQRINNVNGQTITINRNELPAGMYSLHIISEGETLVTRKIIIAD